MTTSGDEDVRRLDVAVDDPLGVRSTEGVGELCPELAHEVEGQRSPGDPQPQGLALEQLHHQEMPVLVLPDVVDRADVGMVKRRGGARLPPEPGDRQLVL